MPSLARLPWRQDFQWAASKAASTSQAVIAQRPP